MRRQCTQHCDQNRQARSPPDACGEPWPCSSGREQVHQHLRLLEPQEARCHSGSRGGQSVPRPHLSEHCAARPQGEPLTLSTRACAQHACCPLSSRRRLLEVLALGCNTAGPNQLGCLLRLSKLPARTLCGDHRLHSCSWALQGAEDGQLSNRLSGAMCLSRHHCQ